MDTPQHVTDLISKFQSAASWPQITGPADAEIYYPATPSGTTMPFGVIEIEEVTPQKFYTGAGTFTGGTGSLVLNGEYSVAEIEKIASNIVAQVNDSEIGIIVKATAGMASDPLASEGEDNDIEESTTPARAITITFQFGVQ